MSFKVDPSALLAAATAQPSDAPSSRLAGNLRAAAAKGDVDGIQNAAKKFEAYFVQMMLKEMRKAQASSDGLFSGTEMETFSGLFDEEIAGRISEGRGIGLASYIMQSFGVEGAAAIPTDPSAMEALGSISGARNVHLPARVLAQGDGYYAWPLPQSEPGRISSDFGRRRDPVHGKHKNHKGMDIAAPRGTPVLSMAPGVVVRADRSPTYGNVVYIDHGGGVVTRYAHQDRLDTRRGDRVLRGQQIGTVGSTGRSTGPHLHLEVRVEGKAIDPHDFLRQSGE